MVPIISVRRLLRRLNDPVELRINLLAFRYFADAERVAASRGLLERTIVDRIRAVVVTAVEGLKDPHAGPQSRVRVHASEPIICRAAQNAMTLLDAERYVGAALRIEAEAHEKLGEEREAKAAINAAIDLLRRYGHPFWLMQAYTSFDELIGSRTAVPA